MLFHLKIEHFVVVVSDRPKQVFQGEIEFRSFFEFRLKTKLSDMKI